jgi:hypothetical protein
MREPERERFLDMATPLEDCEGDEVTSMPDAAMMSLARCFPSRMASPASEGGFGGGAFEGLAGGAALLRPGGGWARLKSWPLFGKGEVVGLIEGDCIVQFGIIAK